MQLSIIIVNFNVKHFLEQCLTSVQNACKNMDAEIFVVDNNSTDGSRKYFSGRFSNVKFIWNVENQGFSKANNSALQLASGEFILFLNPDTILPEDCLEKCLAFFQQHNDIGAMGVRMIDGSGIYLKESKRAFPSTFTSFCKLSGLTALFPSSKIFARYYLGHLDQYKNHEVDVLSGAFMMARKTALDKTGGFDERFFMYGEDIDLSYRIQKAGFTNMYFSVTTIIHFKGESTNRGSLHYVRLFYGAMGLFVKKHYSSGIAPVYNLLIKVAIWKVFLLFGISNRVRRLVSKRRELASCRCCIISDKAAFDFVKSILQKDYTGRRIIGRISPNYITEEDTVGNLQHLPALVSSIAATELIFCINGFSVKEMINLLQQLPEGINYRFHFSGCFGIVGSKEKGS